ncbi:MAG: hypothetical protein GY765_05495 [bacterium]|nr:hypothetical protein [bacterium]
MKRNFVTVGVLLCFIFVFWNSVGCIKVKHEMTINPIHVTVEIRVKIDKALDDAFGDIDGATVSSAEETKDKQGKEGDK